MVVNYSGFICSRLVCIVAFLGLLVVMCVLLSYLSYYVGIAGVILDAELLARSQYPEGPATGHLYTGFSCFPCVYKQMLRWLLCFQVGTTCFSCSPPDLKLNVSVTRFIFLLHVKWPLPPGDSQIAVNKYYYYYYYYLAKAFDSVSHELLILKLEFEVNNNECYFARFKFILAVLLQIQVPWDVTLCTWGRGDWFPTFRKIGVSSSPEMKLPKNNFD
jgi:hypothetical protein